MELGNVIALSARAIELFNAGNDAGLIEELNRPQIAVKNQRGGLVTMAEASDALGVEFTAGFNFTIQAVVEGLRQTQPSDPAFQANMAQALYLFDFRERFSKSDLGVDMSNATLRGTLTALLTQAGWGQEQIDAVLNLGQRQVSPMQYVYGRECTEQDVAAYRVRFSYERSWLANVQSALNDANRERIIEGLNAVIRDMGA